MRSPDTRNTVNRLILLLGLIGLSTVAVALAQERPNTPEYREACDRLVCQCGCHKTVSTCDMENCHSATPIREEVWSRLQAGESVAEIVNVFQERYGLTILSQPPTSGFHLSAWIMPFLFLTGGAVVTARVLKSWRSAKGEQVDEVPPSIDEHQRARIERELRELN